jgi:hypothetical protein
MSRSKLATALLYSLSALLACSAPSTAPTPPAEAGGATNDDTNTAGAGALVHNESDWCAAHVVLQAKCQRCHAEPLENGAPFPLLTYADTQLVDGKGTPRHEKMKAALESDYMPPLFLQLTPAVEPLSPSERTTLLTWLSGQPPLDASDCD